MQRRYVTADVFTDRAFSGNPVAVVLEADGLSTAAMQAIASEFNYSETTFVLDPDDSSHTARIRIFTPLTEVPFAGHPNIGTAYLLARDRVFGQRIRSDHLTFEEEVGLVSVRVTRDAGTITGAELQAPERLAIRSTVALDIAAACISLNTKDVRTAVHAPQVASVGLPFLIIELASRDALSRAKADIGQCLQALPLDGADAIYAYWHDDQAFAHAKPTVLHARMFSPLDGIGEDPATGSAAAATISLLATLGGPAPGERHWRIHQGIDMGRPSLLFGRTHDGGKAGLATYIGGRCVPVFQGAMTIAPQTAIGASK